MNSVFLSLRLLLDSISRFLILNRRNRMFLLYSFWVGKSFMEFFGSLVKSLIWTPIFFYFWWSKLWKLIEGRENVRVGSWNQLRVLLKGVVSQQLNPFRFSFYHFFSRTRSCCHRSFHNYNMKPNRMNEWSISYANSILKCWPIFLS